MKKGTSFYLFSAFFAAFLYALNAPLAYFVLEHLDPALTAGFLYLGAGISMSLILFISKLSGHKSSYPAFEKSDIRFLLAMVALDAAAPVLLMFGLRGSTSETVSLLNCFEIVATALIARLFFSERISKRLALAISLITVATLLLSYSGSGSLKFSPGSLLTIAATLCWGLENNCTGAISEKDPFVTVTIKGLGSGSLALLPVLLSGIKPEGMLYPVLAMALGTVTIGASLIFYITAQKGLGAARTSAAYGISPFIGAFISFLIYKNSPDGQFLIATAIMAAGCLIIRRDDQ